ncbi:MAG: hypothetical protein CL561_10325 [Alphaproteobacteria bacterium]|nr:hypothetical protein [Alphaproteobacteria bacterium]|tara:strand:- start:1779 stop:2462 length:684 start_codon:yes stop_codon:yes gene_type:complete
MALIKAKIFKLIDEGDFNQVKTHLAENPKQLEALTSVGSGYAKRKKITPLHYAIYHKKHDIVRGLIKLGANVHARDNYKRSILHTAAMTNDIDMVNIVLETDVDRDARTKYGYSAEHYTSNKTIQTLINPSYVKEQIAGQTVHVFIRENDHIVSYTDVAEETETTFTTYFNFADKTITRKTKDNDGQSSYMQLFNQTANPHQLSQAAKFLEEHDGNLHGYKPPSVIK